VKSKTLRVNAHKTKKEKEKKKQNKQQSWETYGVKTILENLNNILTIKLLEPAVAQILYNKAYT